jgi:endonuclease/exonuclease/phosphatase family metal-dependent hydrolase
VGASFRLLTANLRRGRADAASFVDLVLRLGVDVVAVQELGDGQARALAAVMPHGLLVPGRDAEGMGLALREPAPARRLPLPRCDALVTELALSGAGTVEVINVHVAAPHRPPLWASLTDRPGQLRRLLARLDAEPRRRCALVGDLNATPLWLVYRRLASRLEDAALGAARREGRRPGRTWGPWPGAPRLLRIDHVLVRGLAVRGCLVAPVPGSDHSAVVADLGAPTGE